MSLRSGNGLLNPCLAQFGLNHFIPLPAPVQVHMPSDSFAFMGPPYNRTMLDTDTHGISIQYTSFLLPSQELSYQGSAENQLRRYSKLKNSVNALACRPIIYAITAPLLKEVPNARVAELVYAAIFKIVSPLTRACGFETHHGHYFLRLYLTDIQTLCQGACIAFFLDFDFCFFLDLLSGGGLLLSKVDKASSKFIGNKLTGFS